MLRHFGSLRRIREADVEALAQVPGVSRPLAEQIRERLGAPPPVRAASPGPAAQ
ncbi:MAG TPA: helix-hairpin-helix domain-containing protein [Terriglobales bacterium]|nr:helix-hairpin-helix domain-containing protein [Terriglobales bacterium]